MELPTLRTERLTLGLVQPGDAARISELAGRKEIARETESIPHPYPEEEAERVVGRMRRQVAAGEAAVFAIRLDEEEGALIGMVGLHPEPEHDRAGVGYWIGVPYWNRGFATEAAGEVLRWGFAERGIRRVYARSFARNDASRRVLEKLGMRREGVLRSHVRKGEEYVDVELYGLLRPEWEEGG